MQCYKCEVSKTKVGESLNYSTMKNKQVMEKEEVETTPMEPLSPMSQMLSSPNLFIVITFGFKVRCNPSSFIEGIQKTLINAPRFSSKMVNTYFFYTHLNKLQYSTRTHACIYIYVYIIIFLSVKDVRMHIVICRHKNWVQMNKIIKIKDITNHKL